MDASICGLERPDVASAAGMKCRIRIWDPGREAPSIFTFSVGFEEAKAAEIARATESDEA